MVHAAHLVALLVSIADPTAGPWPPPGVVDGATARLLQARGATVLDVRSAKEFEEGHVPGALHIPHDQVAARSAELGSKQKPVVLYCRSGRRSGLAAAELVKQGFTAVYDFKTVADWPGPLEPGSKK